VGFTLVLALFSSFLSEAGTPFFFLLQPTFSLAGLRPLSFFTPTKC